MQIHLAGATLALFALSGSAPAQTPAQVPQADRAPAYPQAASAPDQLTPQVLGEMLRSATTFHELVRNLNLNKSLGADQHIQGPDGRLHHPVERTAETIGAGAGAGAAIGAMTRSQNGVLIGALVGGAGGLIIDQILKHREELREKAINDPAHDRPREFKDRDRDRDRHAN